MTSNIIVNLTTNEYFTYINNEDKIRKLKKIYDYSIGTKIITHLINIVDKSITYDSCGESYWNKTDNIIENVDIETFTQKYSNFNKVPEKVINTNK
jgi:hypothetical protein